MLSKSAYDRLKFAVRQYESETRSLNVPQWDRMFQFPPIVTVRILSAMDPLTGLYDAIITESQSNTTWFDGIGQIKVKPSNATDELTIGKRYPARPSYIDYGTGTGSITGTGAYSEVYIAYANCCNLGFVIGSGTGSYTEVGTFTGTVDWFNFESDIVTYHNTTIQVNDSSTTYQNATNTYNNSSVTFNTTDITYGPNSQVTFNTSQPINVTNNNLALQLGNNIQFAINAGPGAANNLFVLNVPVNFNQLAIFNAQLNINNLLALNQVVVPAIAVNQNPLNLAAAGNGPVFKIAINAAGVVLQGLNIGVASEGKLIGIINTGPETVTWANDTSTSASDYVHTPGGIDYVQDVDELIWFYGDGSWVMAAHSQSVGTAGPISGLGTANYLPLWSDPTTLTYSWIKQTPGLTRYIDIASPDSPQPDAIRSTSPKLELGGTIGSPYLQIYASGNKTLYVQLQGTPEQPIITFDSEGTATFFDISDLGNEEVKFSVSGNRGKTGTLRPGATAKGGIINYLGTGNYGTGGSSGVSSVAATAPIHTSAAIGAITLSHDNSLVTPGYYKRANVVVDSKGHLTFAEDGTAGGGIGDITEVTVTAPITGGGTSGSVNIGHDTSGVTGTYFKKANLVVNPTGHITFAEDGTASFDINALGSADVGTGDWIPEYNIALTANKKITPKKLLGLDRYSPGGRLTLQSGTPIVDSNLSSIIYYVPYLHDIINLWDGTRWVFHQFTSKTLSSMTLTSGKPYDIFGYLSSGNLTLEYLAWTNATTRATTLSYQDGRLCKSTDKTRLYLGSFYSASTSETKDAIGARYLYNMYNQVKKPISVDFSGNWTYGVNAWRQVNATASYKIEVMLGQSAVITVRNLLYVIGSVGAGASAGIGIDVTNAVHADCHWCENQSPAPSVAWLESNVSEGFRTINALEIARAGTLNIYGSSASAVQGGLKGHIFC